MTKRITQLNAILADWDETKLPNGQTKFFSVAFVSKKGEFIFIKRGKKTGLRFNMKKHNMKAVQPVDNEGNEIGHVYPVWIHSILYYSGNIEMNLLNNG